MALFSPEQTSACQASTVASSASSAGGGDPDAVVARRTRRRRGGRRRRGAGRGRPFAGVVLADVLVQDVDAAVQPVR